MFSVQEREGYGADCLRRVTWIARSGPYSTQKRRRGHTWRKPTGKREKTRFRDCPLQRRGDSPCRCVCARWSIAISALVCLPCGNGAASPAAGTRAVLACLAPSEWSQAPVGTWRPGAAGAIVPCWARTVKHKRPQFGPIAQGDSVLRQDGFQGCVTHGAILQGCLPMFATSILLPCAAEKSREIRPRTAEFCPSRAGNQPSFANTPTGRQPLAVPLTVTANGYRNSEFGFVGCGNAWRAGVARHQRMVLIGKPATCRRLEGRSPIAEFVRS